MAATRVKTQDVGDSTLQAVDLADFSVSLIKLGIFLASGDLLVGFGATATRLPVGADGQVVTADSTQLAGLAWATPATRLLYSSITSSNTIGTSTAEAQFNQLYNLPANTLKAGDVIKLRFSGRYIQTGTATVTLRVYIGTTSFLDLGAFQPPSAAAEKAFTVEATIVVGTIGAGGTVRGTATAIFHGGLPSVQTSTADFAVDTTAAKDLKMTAQWSVSSASNAVVLRSVDMEIFR